MGRTWIRYCGSGTRGEWESGVLFWEFAGGFRTVGYLLGFLAILGIWHVWGIHQDLPAKTVATFKAYDPYWWLRMLWPVV